VPLHNCPTTQGVLAQGTIETTQAVDDVAAVTGKLRHGPCDAAGCAEALNKWDGGHARRGGYVKGAYEMKT